MPVAQIRLMPRRLEAEQIQHPSDYNLRNVVDKIYNPEAPTECMSQRKHLNIVAASLL
jgi:hypothetical protein